MRNAYIYKDNYKYNKIIDNNINIKKDFYNINKVNNINEKDYLFKDDNNNLSDILAAIRQARSRNSQQQTSISSSRQSTRNPQPITQQTQQQSRVTTIQSNIQTPQTTTQTIKPTNVNDAGPLWSPQSFSGVVYKYNRGVIGIETDGTKHEIIFDGTIRHHNEATAEIGLITNCPVTEKYANPFFNGMEVSKQGTIIIQLEGDSILVYLPELISQEQYQSLESEVNPRSNFSTVAFSHGDDIYDDSKVNIEYLKNFYSKIVSTTKKTSR